MTIGFSQAFGSGSGAVAGGFVLSFATSGSYTLPYDAVVVVGIVGAGGSGGANTQATGGNSGPCGLKRLQLQAGDLIEVTIGAGGAGVTGGANGNAGGTTTVKVNGVIVLSATGGEGGLHAASGPVSPAAVVSVVTGADVWFPGLRAGDVGSGTQGRTGGAAVNLTGDGQGRSSATNAGSQFLAGGSVGTAIAAGQQTAATPRPTTAFFSWGVFPRSDVGLGSNGNSSANAAAGGFGAGGGGVGASATGGPGGVGGGGGAAGSGGNSGKGGDGYVNLSISEAS